MKLSKFIFTKKFYPEKNLIEIEGALVSLHCHHFNCGLLKALEELKGIDGLSLFVKTTEEVYYYFFSKYLEKYHELIKTAKDKLHAASEMYYAFGYGILDLSNLTEHGGIARARSSYYVTAWLAKYGRRYSPVCYFTCGFITGILEAIFDKPLGTYKVEELNCLIMGGDYCKFKVEVI